MRLAIAITMKCNARCAHCCTHCGPYRNEAMSLQQLQRIISEAATVSGSAAFQVDITGGEPFLDFDLLQQVVAHGASLGAHMSCMTNGYWATSPEVATEKLRVLKDKGLQALGVSTSQPHQQFVALNRVRQALESARAVGLTTELKIAVQKGDHDVGGLIDQCRRQLHADVVSVFAITPYLQAGVDAIPQDHYLRKPGLPDGRCPGQVMMMEPDGSAYACCAAGSSNRFLKLGTVGVDSLEWLDTQHRRKARFRLLRNKGPIHFAQEAMARGEAGRLRSSYAGACDLCLHIARDPVLADIAEQICLEQELADLRKAWNLEEEPVAQISDA